MSCRMFNGRLAADHLLDRIKLQTSQLTRAPALACVLIGNNPSSTVYVKHKQQACAKVGISSNVVRLSETITNEQVAEVITSLANDDVTDGILMQMPLPRQLDERDLCNRIPQNKDVDGLNAASIGYQTNGDLPNIGEATILLAHRHTTQAQLADMARKADIVVSATGVTGLITPDMIKENAVLIDVGFTRKMTQNGNVRLMGDIEPSCRQLASLMSPVPGGIGPLTIAHLCRNTLNAYLRAQSLPIMPLLE